MIDWLKILMGGKASLIKQLDRLEQPLADEARDLQKQIADKNPDQIAKILIDKFQMKLCKMWGVDPKKVDAAFPDA